ncbi:MAG TPA: hypothetical protein VHJ34_12390 [Actinomycetota bacterium]|nr:hypothetical protein [Actinomycetota bacterium]
MAVVVAAIAACAPGAGRDRDAALPLTSWGPGGRPDGARTPAPAASPDAAPTTAPAPTPVVSADAAPADLYYVDGTKVLRRRAGGGTDVLADVPTPDVVAPPDTPLLAYVTGAPSPDDDFLVDPVLHVLDPWARDHLKIGAGVSPLWQPAMPRVAYLQPVGDRRCEGERCSGAVRVALTNAFDGAVDVLLPAGRWSLLGWAGDVLLVADATRPERTVTVDFSGRRGSLPVPPREIWGASPDGRWLLVARPGEAAFVPLDRGHIAGSPRPVPLAGRVIADGSWAHDSSRVAAVLLDPSGRRPSKVVVLAPESPRPVTVAGSAGASSSVLWAPTGAEIAFAAEAGRRLEARVCALEGAPCRRGPSWTSGVRLLQLY